MSCDFVKGRRKRINDDNDSHNDEVNTAQFNPLGKLKISFSFYFNKKAMNHLSIHEYHIVDK